MLVADVQDSCPALTEMENAMVNWVGRALGFPETFLFQDSPPASQGGGTVTESGSDAILCAVLAARQWKINQIIEEEKRKGGSKFDTIHDIGKRLVVYSSKDVRLLHVFFTAHSCIEKACKLAMLRCRPIQPLEENQWGITGEQIEEEIKKSITHLGPRERLDTMLHQLHPRDIVNCILRQADINLPCLF
ncbi:hypothetical protein OSTOST_05435 [Ostertagia ostertagi]